jgi:hypothetical protein
LTLRPAIFLNSRVDRDPVALPSERIHEIPALKRVHFFWVMDIIGKRVVVWIMTPFQVPGVTVSSLHFLSSS